MQTATPQTKVLKTLDVKKVKAEDIAKEIGRQLGSPINGKNVGDKFPVTLTGKIEIREFNGQKGAYHTTKEGYSIRVNASFNPEQHKEGAVLNAVCRELQLEGMTTPRKFCAFAD